MSTVVRRPKFDIRFITEHSDYHIVWDAAKPDNQYMTESIVSLTTKNALSDDSSAFSFVVAGDTQWEKIVTPNDLVVLKIRPNELVPGSPELHDAPENDMIMLGLVSEIRIEGKYGDNSKTYRITGQSLAKAFIQFELRVIQQVTMVIQNFGWMDNSQNQDMAMALMGKNVSQISNAILDRFMQYMKYNFSETKSKFNEMEQRIVREITSWDKDETLLDPMPFVGFEGTLNQLLRDIVNRPFCEMFFDSYASAEGEEKSKLVIRRTPFDKEDWYATKRHHLNSSDVVSETVAQNDLDAYSLFNVVPQDGMDEYASSFNAKPQFSEMLVEKYGYKLLETEHRYLNGLGNSDVAGDGVTDSGVSLVEKYSKRLYNWYSLNPNFFSGDIVVIGHPDYRLGNRLYYVDDFNNDKWEYYIESVEHNFSYTDGYTTTLGVTRGLKVKSETDDGFRFDPPAGPPAKFEGGYLGELTIEEINALWEGSSMTESDYVNTGLSGAVAKKAGDFALKFADGASGATAYDWGGGRGMTSNPLLGPPPYTMDCSAFVYWVYKYTGLDLSTNGGYTTFTMREKTNVTTIGQRGSGIKARDLIYGDIVYFNNDNHIGIYVGNGEFVGFNGSGSMNFAKGCEKRPMDSGYWAGVWEGHVQRYVESKAAKPTNPVEAPNSNNGLWTNPLEGSKTGGTFKPNKYLQ